MFARRLVVLGLIAMFVTSPTWALEIGDDAPPLMIKKWVKGEKVKLEDLKNREIVVIEFWATWCAPCRKSIPHLTELQEKFNKDRVRVIGVSTEDTSTVMNFVHGMGKKMEYTVAVDNDGKTSAALMTEFGVNGIPHAFIIDRKGKIAWHGHPMDEDFEEELESLVLKQPAPEDKKLKEANRLQKEYFELAQKGDASKAELSKIGDQMIKLGSNDKDFLVDVTNMIVKSKKIKTRDLDTAKKAIETACELTENKVCEVIELRARVEYEMGDKKAALKYLREALSVCEDFDHEDKLEKRIESLRKKVEKSA
ncbi:MAG: TlpA family protein disulfide reductase [Phycisphaerales bacterium]|nr:TlpA family protein disulfide reductase [Phycisphaerales bacterium]MCB9862726.1 TlpA family protein disulfide reductase [Phycisphaerales bacterium]